MKTLLIFVPVIFLCISLVGSNNSTIENSKQSVKASTNNEEPESTTKRMYYKSEVKRLLDEYKKFDKINLRSISGTSYTDKLIESIRKRRKMPLKTNKFVPPTIKLNYTVGDSKLNWTKYNELRSSALIPKQPNLGDNVHNTDTNINNLKPGDPLQLPKPISVSSNLSKDGSHKFRTEAFLGQTKTPLMLNNHNSIYPSPSKQNDNRGIPTQEMNISSRNFDHSLSSNQQVSSIDLVSTPSLPPNPQMSGLKSIKASNVLASDSNNQKPVPKKLENDVTNITTVLIESSVKPDNSNRSSNAIYFPKELSIHSLKPTELNTQTNFTNGQNQSTNIVDQVNNDFSKDSEMFGSQNNKSSTRHLKNRYSQSFNEEKNSQSNPLYSRLDPSLLENATIVVNSSVLSKPPSKTPKEVSAEYQVVNNTLSLSNPTANSFKMQTLDDLNQSSNLENITKTPDINMGESNLQPSKPNNYSKNPQKTNTSNLGRHSNYIALGANDGNPMHSVPVESSAGKNNNLFQDQSMYASQNDNLRQANKPQNRYSLSSNTKEQVIPFNVEKSGVRQNTQSSVNTNYANAGVDHYSMIPYGINNFPINSYPIQVIHPSSVFKQPLNQKLYTVFQGQLYQLVSVKQDSGHINIHSNTNQHFFPDTSHPSKIKISHSKQQQQTKMSYRDLNSLMYHHHHNSRGNSLVYNPNERTYPGKNLQDISYINQQRTQSPNYPIRKEFVHTKNEVKENKYFGVSDPSRYHGDGLNYISKGNEDNNLASTHNLATSVRANNSPLLNQSSNSQQYEPTKESLNIAQMSPLNNKLTQLQLGRPTIVSDMDVVKPNGIDSFQQEHNIISRIETNPSISQPERQFNTIYPVEYLHNEHINNAHDSKQTPKGNNPWLKSVSNSQNTENNMESSKMIGLNGIGNNNPYNLEQNNIFLDRTSKYRSSHNSDVNAFIPELNVYHNQLLENNKYIHPEQSNLSLDPTGNYISPSNNNGVKAFISNPNAYHQQHFETIKNINPEQNSMMFDATENYIIPSNNKEMNALMPDPNVNHQRLLENYRSPYSEQNNRILDHTRNYLSQRSINVVNALTSEPNVNHKQIITNPNTYFPKQINMNLDPTGNYISPSNNNGIQAFMSEPNVDHKKIITNNYNHFPKQSNTIVYPNDNYIPSRNNNGINSLMTDPHVKHQHLLNNHINPSLEQNDRVLDPNGMYLSSRNNKKLNVLTPEPNINHQQLSKNNDNNVPSYNLVSDPTVNYMSSNNNQINAFKTKPVVNHQQLNTKKIYAEQSNMFLDPTSIYVSSNDNEKERYFMPNPNDYQHQTFVDSSYHQKSPNSNYGNQNSYLTGQQSGIMDLKPISNNIIHPQYSLSQNNILPQTQSSLIYSPLLKYDKSIVEDLYNKGEIVSNPFLSHQNVLQNDEPIKVSIRGQVPKLNSSLPRLEENKETNSKTAPYYYTPGSRVTSELPQNVLGENRSPTYPTYKNVQTSSSSNVPTSYMNNNQNIMPPERDNPPDAVIRTVTRPTSLENNLISLQSVGLDNRNNFQNFIDPRTRRTAYRFQTEEIHPRTLDGSNSFQFHNYKIPMKNTQMYNTPDQRFSNVQLINNPGNMGIRNNNGFFPSKHNEIPLHFGNNEWPNMFHRPKINEIFNEESQPNDNSLTRKNTGPSFGISHSDPLGWKDNLNVQFPSQQDLMTPNHLNFPNNKNHQQSFGRDNPPEQKQYGSSYGGETFAAVQAKPNVSRQQSIRYLTPYQNNKQHHNFHPPLPETTHDYSYRTLISGFPHANSQPIIRYSFDGRQRSERAYDLGHQDEFSSVSSSTQNNPSNSFYSGYNKAANYEPNLVNVRSIDWAKYKRSKKQPSVNSSTLDRSFATVGEERRPSIKLNNTNPNASKINFNVANNDLTVSKTHETPTFTGKSLTLDHTYRKLNTEKRIATPSAIWNKKLIGTKEVNAGYPANTNNPYLANDHTGQNQQLMSNRDIFNPMSVVERNPIVSSNINSEVVSNEENLLSSIPGSNGQNTPYNTNRSPSLSNEFSSSITSNINSIDGRNQENLQSPYPLTGSKGQNPSYNTNQPPTLPNEIGFSTSSNMNNIVRRNPESLINPYPVAGSNEKNPPYNTNQSPIIPNKSGSSISSDINSINNKRDPESLQLPYPVSESNSQYFSYNTNRSPTLSYEFGSSVPSAINSMDGRTLGNQQSSYPVAGSYGINPSYNSNRSPTLSNELIPSISSNMNSNVGRNPGNLRSVHHITGSNNHANIYQNSGPPILSDEFGYVVPSNINVFGNNNRGNLYKLYHFTEPNNQNPTYYSNGSPSMSTKYGSTNHLNINMKLGMNQNDIQSSNTMTGFNYQNPSYNTNTPKVLENKSVYTIPSNINSSGQTNKGNLQSRSSDSGPKSVNPSYKTLEPPALPNDFGPSSISNRNSEYQENQQYVHPVTEYKEQSPSYNSINKYMNSFNHQSPYLPYQPFSSAKSSAHHGQHEYLRQVPTSLPIYQNNNNKLTNSQGRDLQNSINHPLANNFHHPFHLGGIHHLPTISKPINNNANYYNGQLISGNNDVGNSFIPPSSGQYPTDFQQDGWKYLSSMNSHISRSPYDINRSPTSTNNYYNRFNTQRSTFPSPQSSQENHEKYLSTLNSPIQKFNYIQKMPISEKSFINDLSSHTNQQFPSSQDLRSWNNQGVGNIGFQPNYNPNENSLSSQYYVEQGTPPFSTKRVMIDANQNYNNFKQTDSQGLNVNVYTGHGLNGQNEQQAIEQTKPQTYESYNGMNYHSLPQVERTNRLYAQNYINKNNPIYVPTNPIPSTHKNNNLQQIYREPPKTEYFHLNAMSDVNMTHQLKLNESKDSLKTNAYKINGFHEGHRRDFQPRFYFDGLYSPNYSNPHISNPISERSFGEMTDTNFSSNPSRIQVKNSGSANHEFQPHFSLANITLSNFSEKQHTSSNLGYSHNDFTNEFPTLNRSSDDSKDLQKLQSEADNINSYYDSLSDIFNKRILRLNKLSKNLYTPVELPDVFNQSRIAPRNGDLMDSKNNTINSTADGLIENENIMANQLLQDKSLADSQITQQEGCSVNGTIMEVGEEWTVDGVCGVFACLSNGVHVMDLKCPKLNNMENEKCEVEEGDPLLEFPLCCPSLNCIKGKNSQIIEHSNTTNPNATNLR